ncbi:MAG: GntR family transcriptional regulator [Clostridia bacterium]
MVSLKHKAYEIIKENIISCRYAPGEFLNEADLMEEIGTSRTPIREALNKLEQEKLVRIVPKKGIMTSELTLKEINDVYQVRIMLEPQLVRLWGSNIPVEELEVFRTKLIQFNPMTDLKERYELNDYLHRTIIKHCQNTYFNEWMCLIYGQNRRIGVITGQVDVWLEQNNADHLKITEYLLLGEYETAAVLLQQHLEHAKKVTFDCLLKNGM